MKDKFTLRHMLKYCIQIDETLENYNRNQEEFFNSHIFRNAISMLIFQIGELANHLTDEYVENTVNEMPWYEIIGMRNHFAHGYIKMDNNKIWDTAINDIPVLKKFCEKEIDKLG